jgi:hypothetical protein
VFSKRKTLLLGALVEVERWRGTWSEVGRQEEVRVESGRAKLHSGLTKTLSRRARIGGSCWLDQVNWRSRRGISISPRLLIKSLKREASEELKFPLDLSLGDRIRLKSPIIETEPDKDAKMSSREVRKALFWSWTHGP